LLPLLSGCVIFSSDEGDLQEELDSHRLMWETAGITDYRIRFQRLCLNCSVDLLVPVHITVRDGVIESVTDVDTGQPVDPDNFGFYQTIDEMFDTIQFAIDENAAEIDVTYDEVLGFPSDANIDLSRSLINDDTQFEVRDFQDLS
jgi:hypothetical protein